MEQRVEQRVEQPKFQIHKNEVDVCLIRTLLEHMTDVRKPTK